MLLQESPPLAHAIPPNTPHSIVHSLPEWNDNTDFAVSKKELFDALEATYPRFVLHPRVKELVGFIKRSSGISEDEECQLYPSLRAAETCRAFIARYFPQDTSKIDVRSITKLALAPCSQQIFAVIYPKEQDEKAMKFWTFAGEGISSRLAEACLRRIQGSQCDDLGLPPLQGHIFSDYYTQRKPLRDVVQAKDAIRKRFAGVLDEQGRNIRGVPTISHTDVYIYPSGMSAVWNAHLILRGTIGQRKSMESIKTAHVNILYVDSYKLLDLTSPGYYFFTTNTTDDLEKLLATGSAECPAVLGIFTDFPANPNLQSANLPHLRALADKYGIPLVIDETVGSHLNIQVLPYADLVISSLTKMFSGLANVLGGALMLNANSRFYKDWKQYLDATYEDIYFETDALVMEMNSRGMEERVAAMNRNAEALSDMFYAQSVASGNVGSGHIIKEVFYPKYQDRENYEQCWRSGTGDISSCKPGYGSLMSVSFTSLEVAKVFYSTLPCGKGPSLGAVVTLVTPFTAIAFPPEKKAWVKEHYLDETLVRISVGMEDRSSLLNGFALALKKAEEFCAGNNL
ncbi:hypothetical protein GYMLUDRAFT_228442 [Collybiopsis luxurians FD-317 M1]|uniref:Cystathionine gamma-synthase n=1 Tax=Collybiopsis luxurians FD-317 M1 TaxID=944289 RepID=A0A0D0B3N1_9AGAR|nr:hypothetical protein GYMLUDRAFT_228442 [Collybiopsis luxurians FD-317 M1]